MRTLEEFDREVAAKRARLEKDHALARALPTAGRTVTWLGENGWQADGRTRNPDIERSTEIAPWIIHSPFRGAERIAFRAPDSLAGDKGEHVSSQYRTTFVRKYLLAVLDAFEPYMINTVAIRGHYASYVPESFDWKKDKDYKDANEISRGLFVVNTAQNVGPQAHYSKAELEFYARLESGQVVNVSFDIGHSFSAYKLMPQPRYESQAHNARPRGWYVSTDTGAVNVFRRSGGDDYGYSCEWLFKSRADMERAIGAQS